jgi:hypothetical protein
VEETVQPDLRSRPPEPNRHIGNRYSPTFEQTRIRWGHSSLPGSPEGVLSRASSFAASS